MNDFFEKGKETESGTVEELRMEHVRYFKTKNAACICFYAMYKSFPKPAIRTTMYLEKDRRSWKIKRVHCSFEPDR